MKEAGIYIADCPTIAKKVEVYYNNLWTLGLLNASAHTTTTWDQQWQLSRTVPCWSHFVTPAERCKYDHETKFSGDFIQNLPLQYSLSKEEI